MIHAQKRMVERYRMVINRSHIKELEGRISVGDAILYRKKSKRNKQYIIDYRGKYIRVAYFTAKKNSNHIRTILPMGMKEHAWLEGYLRGSDLKSNSYPCHSCLRYFDTRKGLRIHISRIHKGERK